jgi:uncharacterized protein
MTAISRFKSLATYQSSSEYQLLPMRFLKLDEERYVLTNLVGEYVILSREDLRKLVQKQLLPHTSLYNQLKSKHFLYDDESSVPLELLAIKYRTKQSSLALFTALHIFVVTLRCDHSCPYCQVSRQSEDRTAFDMTKEMADRAINALFRSPSPLLKVEFQGGESLLNFELIRYIVGEVKQLNALIGKDIEFVIATNLALVTEEILDFCAQEKIFISTSLDGPDWLHNINRPRRGQDSHQRAIKGIEQVRSR